MTIELIYTQEPGCLIVRDPEEFSTSGNVYDRAKDQRKYSLGGLKIQTTMFVGRLIQAMPPRARFAFYTNDLKTFGVVLGLHFVRKAGSRVSNKQTKRK